jgi:drug/metabolite transporter (DMT)-like permease
VVERSSQGRSPGLVRLRATIALAVAIVCWASIPLFLKHFSTALDGWTVNAYRYTIAAAMHFPVILRTHWNSRLPHRLWRRALLPTVFNIVSQNLWTWAPYFIDPGLMSFLARGSIIWSVTGSFLLFPDERPAIRSAQFTLGLGLAAVGYAGLMAQQGGLAQKATMWGVLIMLACGVFTAGYSLSVRKVLSDVNPRLAFAVIALYTSASAQALMLLFGHLTPLVALDVRTAASLSISAVLGLGIAQVAYYTAISHLGVAICSCSMLMASFLTTLASGIVFGERFTGGQWMAGVLLVAGGISIIGASRHVGKSEEARSSVEKSRPRPRGQRP